jgi:hypothetical protein
MGTSPDSIRRVGESDLLELARVARSTWQSWVRAGLVGQTSDGLYDESAVVELVIVAPMLSALDLRQAKSAWVPARQLSLRRAVARPLNGESLYVAVVDLHTWRLRVAITPQEVWSAIQEQTPFPRGRIVFDLGPSIAEGRSTYWSRAQPSADLLKDRRRKRRSAVPTTRRTRKSP